MTCTLILRAETATCGRALLFDVFSDKRSILFVSRARYLIDSDDLALKTHMLLTEMKSLVLNDLFISTSLKHSDSVY